MSEKKRFTNKVAKRNTSIRINGKHYDALSGALINFEATAAQPMAAVKSIDGVIGGKSRPISAKAATHPVKSVSKQISKPVTKTTRTAAKHAKVTRTKPSTTLMRHAVKKPQTSLKSRTKVSQAIKHTSKTAIIPKTSLHGINHVRAARAAEHQISPRVSHFAKEVSLVTAAIKADVHETVKAIDNAIVIPQTYAPNGAYRPDIRRVRVKATTQTATSDIFEQALLRATSHEQPEPKISISRLRSLRRRMISFSAGAVVVLALVGFMGFQKQDAIQFRVAASSASFSATMPGYQPQGYSLQNVKNSNGTLFAQYAKADKNYVVSQKASQLGDQSLSQLIADEQGPGSFTTIAGNDTTIYLYGRNQAAWAHNGVLYQVLGNGVLSSGDFAQIASSM